MLLNGSPFVFVIDLAALASRREYLKLDKWLKDKLKEHQVKQKSPGYHIIPEMQVHYSNIFSIFSVGNSVGTDD